MHDLKTLLSFAKRQLLAANKVQDFKFATSQSFLELIIISSNNYNNWFKKFKFKITATINRFLLQFPVILGCIKVLSRLSYTLSAFQEYQEYSQNRLRLSKQQFFFICLNLAKTSSFDR